MKYTIGDLGAIGWVPDVDGFELPPNAWTDVSNVRFRNGRVEVMPGHLECVSEAAASSVGKYHWATHYTAPTGESQVAFAGTTRVAVWDIAQAETTSIQDAGSPFTGTYSDKWTGGVLTGLLVINNGIDTPRYWAGDLGADVLAVPGWNSGWRAKSLRPFKNYLVALGITKSGTYYPHMVKTSCASEPGAMPTSWNEADATLDAYEGDLPETQDVLVDGLQMSDDYIIYKERSAYSMHFIGVPLVWRFTRLPGEMGMIAPNCAVNTPIGHVVMGFGDIYTHQGQGPRSILTGKAKDWFVENLDDTAYRNSFLVTNTDKAEVWCCFPTTGNTYPNMAIVFNWETGALSKRTLPNLTFACETTSAIVVDPFDFSLAISDDTFDGGPADTFDEYEVNLAAKMNLVGCAISDSSNRGVIYALDIGPYALDTVQTGYIERVGLHFDDDHSWNLVNAIWPRWGGSGITASYIPTGGLTGTGSPETASGLSSGVNLTESYVPQKYSGSVSGRYFNLRFDLTAGSPARMKTLVFDIAKQGQY